MSATKNHTINNDTTGPVPQPAPRAAAAVVAAAAAAAAGSAHQAYVRAPEAHGHGAKGHELPYDDHHGLGGAFVMVGGQRTPVRVRIDESKKPSGYYIVVDGQEIETDRDGAAIAK